VLFFLHGALIEPDMWFYPILELKRKYRIIAPCFPPDRMSALEAVAFIQAIFQQEGIEKAVFIGMSYGGGVAQYLGEKHPGMIEKLILTHTSTLGRVESYERLEKMKKLMGFVPQFLIKMLLKKRVEDFPSSEWDEFHKSYFNDIRTRITKRVFREYIDSMVRFANDSRDINADRRNWEGETVLLGTRGDKDAFPYFERLIELYPDSERYIFEEEGGHHMSFLFPEKYTQVLSRYLD
jgi:pimeloyl-ACP methyl ester carboxylesterase